MNHEVEEVRFDSLDDEALEPVLDLVNAINRESKHRNVDLSVDELRMLSGVPGRVRHHFVARDEEGNVVGVGEASYADDGTNPDTLRCQVRVDVDHRRLGVGTALLRAITELADELGRTRLQGWHFDTIPDGAAFATAVGAKERLRFHDNMVRVEDLDVDQLTVWNDLGPQRAPGYTVEVIEGPWPEELLGDIAHLYYVLERDMPLPDGHEPRNWTPELVAAMQEHYQRGTQSISAIAFHGDPRRAVGLTQLLRRNSDPTTWIVTTTMVEPSHRGRGIGKWIKAAANLAALARWPGGIYEETGNAFTNEAMLAINRAMGFEHELTTTDLEVDVEDAKAYLASKGA